MNNTILNWNGTDHNAIYTRQLREHPLYYDPNLKVWVTYSYEYCKAVFLDSDAHVPEPIIGDDNPLNDTAKLLIRKMARISNNQQHIVARGVAMMMYQRISSVAVDQILEHLLNGIDTQSGFDWVAVVGKRLTISLILKGLDFNEEDSAFITANLESMALIMSPNKTDGDIKMINDVVGRFYEIAEKYVISAGFSAHDRETIDLIVCNLIGLFVQSYDGGWGLLCNTLLSLAAHRYKTDINNYDKAWYKKLVNETLRWDPPVHNTRRVAANDILLDGQIIRAGETILIVLAAANLDDKVFKDPLNFNLMRTNNEQHLTFGLGGHNCVARYFNIGMAADTCSFLMNKYCHITILQKELGYEPKLNVRLVKQLMVSLS